MELGTQYLDQLSEDGASDQQIQQWIKSYFSKMPEVLEDDSVDLYAIIEGRIVAANPWVGDDTYDYTQTDWYQAAKAADGEVIFTAAYQDAITGQQVITIAQKARHSNNMLMFDVFPADFHSTDAMESLPEGSAYFLCDQAGTLLYAHAADTQSFESKAQMQSYAHGLLEGIADGSLEQYDASIAAPDGTMCGVYYLSLIHISRSLKKPFIMISSRSFSCNVSRPFS